MLIAPYSLPAHINQIQICVSLDVEQEDYSSTYVLMSSHLMTSPATSLKNRVSEISQLEDDWNCEGAVAPSEEVIKNTFKFLDVIEAFGFVDYLNSDNIVPTPYGTIDLDFETESKGIVSVEIGKQEIGYFTEYNDHENFMSEGIKTSFKEIPEELYKAILLLEETTKANAVSA